MRPTRIVATLLVLCCASAARAQQEPEPSRYELMRRLQRLEVELAALRKKVAELEKKLAEKAAPEADDAATGFPGDWRERGPNRKTLRKITLPENATKEQVYDYVRRICEVSRGQNVFGSMDPQIAMLKKVGPAHLDVLLDFDGRAEREADYYVIFAVKALARDEHKPMVIKAMTQCRQLVEVVRSKGWEQDAKTVLLTELRSRPKYLPTEWIEAVASLKDPTTYDDLKQYLIYGSNRLWAYRAIKDLPGIDLKQTVAEAWRIAKNVRYDRDDMAPVAAEWGHLDALELLVNALLAPKTRDTFRGDARRAVLKHTSIYGTNEQLTEWFRKNRDRLVFDPKTRKFTVPE